jgi:hypothetical protein
MTYPNICHLYDDNMTWILQLSTINIAAVWQTYTKHILCLLQEYNRYMSCILWRLYDIHITAIYHKYCSYMTNIYQTYFMFITSIWHLYAKNLPREQVAHCKRERQHEKSDPITGKFCSFCFLDIHLQKVSSIFWSNINHGSVGLHTLKSVCKALEDPSNHLIRQEGYRSYPP